MQAIQGRPGHVGLQVGTVMLDMALVKAHPALRDLYQQHPGRTVRMTVRDDGRGMDAATLERIFEPFFTTKPAGEGTGLGLSVVHGIVRAHRGAIEVTSQPGKGSCFTIYLPAGDLGAGVALPEAGMETATLPEGGGQHILYLDDDEALVSLVKRLLERRGLRVSGYVTQDEALSALRADPGTFDLVVSDYNMPGMSGLDVAREVRAIRGDLPVAIASGFIDDALRAQAAGAGVRNLIFKANVVEDLCDAVQRLLPGRRQV
jgi:two-component system cell cycle sensor histidine kinase/response regulator CckA